MNILLVHNYYQQPGGEDVAYACEAALLEAQGHKVTRFEAHNDAVNALSPLSLAASTVWNRGSYSEVRRIIRDHAIDIAHFHNTFPLVSPAAYYAARREGVPVVQTLHNFRLLCPSAVFFRDGHICELCLEKTIKWPAVRHACYRNSRPASGAIAAMLSVHRLIGTYRRAVSAFITLTAFAKDKFVAGGLPEEKLFVKPNYLRDDPGVGSGSGNYALFVGRLSGEKGIDFILDAWQNVGDIPLKVAGDGPLAGRVSEAAARNANIQWLGRQDSSAVQRLLGDAKALIIPSECYENLPFTLIESYARGTPVIAPRLGAMPSLIQHGKTGLLFEPGSSANLARAVRACWIDLDGLPAMRGPARREFELKYTAEANYTRLMEIYAQAMRLPAAQVDLNVGTGRA